MTTFHQELFNRIPDRKIRQAQASFRANKLALDLLDKHVNLAVASAKNAHYKNDAIYSGLLYLSLNNTYAETAMEDLRIKHHIDAPSGTEFLYRMKKLFGIQSNQRRLDYFERVRIQMKIWERLTAVNDELVAMAVNSGLLLKKPVVCAIDYTKIAYYGTFNSNVVRGKHDKGTELFYEYASISVVENGRRICIYTVQITLLSEGKDGVIRKLVTEARARGIKIKILLIDRAFFTVDCINALNEMEIKFIMPCVGNERVKAAIDTFGMAGKIDKFPIYNANRVEATFTMVIVVRNDKGELISFATNISGWGVRYFVKRIPKEYRKRWSIETTFRKIKEVVGMTTSPLPELRLIYFMLAMILYNIWQVVNYCFLSNLQASPEKKMIFVTIRAMIRFFVNYITQTLTRTAPVVMA
ncbi:MAG: transposase [Nitrososphaerales archaeon]